MQTAISTSPEKMVAPLKDKNIELVEAGETVAPTKSLTDRISKALERLRDRTSSTKGPGDREQQPAGDWSKITADRSAASTEKIGR